jgi:hypothetical protein
MTDDQLDKVLDAADAYVPPMEDWRMKQILETIRKLDEGDVCCILGIAAERLAMITRTNCGLIPLVDHNGKRIVTVFARFNGDRDDWFEKLAPRLVELVRP